MADELPPLPLSPLLFCRGLPRSAVKVSGTRSRNRGSGYLSPLPPVTSTRLRSSGILLFQVPGSRMTRDRSKVESTIQPLCWKGSLMSECHHWLARRANSRSSGVSKSQGSSSSHHSCKPCPLSMMIVGSKGNAASASRASSGVGGNWDSLLCTGWLTSMSAQNAGIPATWCSRSRLWAVSRTPVFGAKLTPVYTSRCSWQSTSASTASKLEYQRDFLSGNVQTSTRPGGGLPHSLARKSLGLMCCPFSLIQVARAPGVKTQSTVPPFSPNPSFFGQTFGHKPCGLERG